MFLEEYKAKDIVFVPWKKVDALKQENFKRECGVIVNLLSDTCLTFRRNSILLGYTERSCDMCLL